MVATTAPQGLIDTDIVIDARRGLPNGINFLAAQRFHGPVTISIVSAMELVAGCRDSRSLNRLQQFLATVATVPLSPACSMQAFHWMEAYCLSHGLTVADALIAATALEGGLPVFTRNVKHFQMLPGLRVIRPY